MKKLLIIGFLLSFIVSCKKQAATPAPTTNNTNSSSLNPALPTYVDSCLAGDWMLDTVQSYVNGSYIVSTYHNDPVNCRLLLTANVYDPQSNSKHATTGLDCNNTATYWRTHSGKLDMSNTLYQLLFISPTKLVMLYGTMGSGGTGLKYYLHK